MQKRKKMFEKSKEVKTMDRIEGYIDSVHSNYGVIKAQDGDFTVKYLFYIFPDMISNGVFKSTKKITFSLTTSQVRGVKILLAYNVKSIDGQKSENFPVNQLSINNTRDYHDFIFKNFFKENDDTIIDNLAEEDIRFKEFILKWVLFMENEIKKSTLKLSRKYELTLKEIYTKLSESSNTKKIHKDIFDKLKRNYVFRSEFELLEISQASSGDIRSFKVDSAPFELYLENSTIDELGKIVKVFFTTFIKVKDIHDKDSLFLGHVIDMFLELSIIRNACAHGNPLIPLILDDKYSPNYLHDLSSVYPKFNSGDSVEDWKLFEPLRWVTRQLTKKGIAPLYKGGLQVTGLYTAKYILINPARRSFFSFLFIIEYFFKFVAKDEAPEIKFKKEFNNFLPYFDLGEDDSDDTNKLFVKYPKEEPVLKQIFKFIYPLYYDPGFWLLVYNRK